MSFTWKRINSLIDDMFTTDYKNGSLAKEQDPFYGYEGVCLFKYFFEKNDPQIGFV